MCLSQKSPRTEKVARSSKGDRCLKDCATYMKLSSENSLIHHTKKIKAQMCQLIGHLRDDVGKVTEPKAQALFETSAEVLTGLVKAFDDYEKKSEKAWRIASMTPRSKERSTNASRR
jgi:hypothetical protein